VDFQLENSGPMPPRHDHSTRHLFRPPSKLQVCSQAIWTHLRQLKPEPITLVDLRRDLGYGSSDVYRSARSLVAHGFAEKTEVSWSAIVKGKGTHVYPYRPAFSA
jgi:predicted transcriptional regulator